jgi:hypothetical protein
MMAAEVIDASPTKEFFIDMLVRDIDLDRSILDLIDNSVDAWNDNGTLSDKFVQLTMNKDVFEIYDNCGGMDFNLAKNYAFRFGRPKEREATPNSVGQFGVGMKRTLFKLGESFEIISNKNGICFKVSVNAAEWKGTDTWQFDLIKLDEDLVPDGHTKVVIGKIFDAVGEQFQLKNFCNEFNDDCSKAYFSSLKKGLKIQVNDELITGHQIELLQSETLKPVKVQLNSGQVNITITAGISERKLKEGGWYIICNGRLVMAAEQSEISGWRQDNIPQYHPDYAFFRGVVEFTSDNSELLPWTTTKTGVDRNNLAFRNALFHMKRHMKPIVSFLKDRVKEEKQHKLHDIEETPIASSIKEAPFVEFHSIVNNDVFSAPERVHYEPKQKVIKVQYSVETSRLEKVKALLKVDTAAAVGKETFEYFIKYEMPDE